MNPNPIMLSDLLYQNESFDKLKGTYQNKIRLTKSFKSKSEFINQEIDRIKKEFLKPITLTLGKGDFISGGSFDFTEYRKFAYDWLSMGQDLALYRIYSTATEQYIRNDIFKKIYVKDEFETAILNQLKVGAGYIKYEKFLKDELKKNEKPWWKWVWIIGTFIVGGIIFWVEFANKFFDFIKNFFHN